MIKIKIQIFIAVIAAIIICNYSKAQEPLPTDTTIVFTPTNPTLIKVQQYAPLMKAFGIDFLLSNNGFGLGIFYKYELSPALSLMFNLVISDVKDDEELELYDPYYGNSFIYGKKNRLLFIPLTASVQYRLFKDDIVDNFRPFIMGGIGPTMIFVAPYAKVTDDMYGRHVEKIEFFSSLKYGQAKYTFGGFIGAGVYLGITNGHITGLSLKYYFARIPNGIEVMDGKITKNFGGLYISLSFGSMY